jgi:hypothetical protein
VVIAENVDVAQDNALMPGSLAADAGVCAATEQCKGSRRDERAAQISGHGISPSSGGPRRHGGLQPAG